MKQAPGSDSTERGSNPWDPEELPSMAFQFETAPKSV